MSSETNREEHAERLEELKAMVHDESYMSGAILRIANVLSDEIMDGIGVSYGGWK
ncbi:MAG TPA: hypothetical protein PLW80_11925 [Spirochaetales bacterium]|nr:hypothetical protein [Spirochaetales bacterium]HPB67266.1 hypothetical protein [Spirochaetales bacterium]HPG87069.1 hypothetical protein [Spirochaetales bacterium]HPM72473.1 hypothetical protein [Spirochaetales bacterium]